MRKILVSAPVLIWLFAGSAHAGDPILKVYSRKDAATAQDASGASRQPGRVLLVPVDPKAKLAPFQHDLKAELLLPKVTTGPVRSVALRISFEPKNDVVSVSHFELDIPAAIEQEIHDYIEDPTTGQERRAGERFEPVIEIRGFTLNATPSAASVILPTYLEFEFDAKNTDLGQDSIIFRGIYVAQELRANIEDGTYWTTDPVVDPTWAKCQISFDPTDDRITFHFLDRAQFAWALGRAGDKGIAFTFGGPGRAGPTNRALFQQEQIQAETARKRIQPWVRKGINGQPVAQAKRPAVISYPGRNLRFSTAAPASNLEMPLYFKGSYTHSADATGKTKDVANIEFDFNGSDKLWQPLNFLNLTPHINIGPVLNLKMNTTGIVNDENSLRFRVPIQFIYFPRACCTGKDANTFHLPLLKTATTYFGYQAEAARVTNKRSNGGFIGERLTFLRVNSDNASFRAEPLVEWEVGNYKEEMKNTFGEANGQGPVKGSDGQPVTATALVQRHDNFNRGHLGWRSTLTLGPNISFTATYDLWRLFKAESYFDTSGSASGAFTPYPGQTLPTSFTSVDSQVMFISSGILTKGTRRYLDLSLALQLNKYFDVTAEYSRGELPPSFQFVNKAQIGLTFKILGKDSFAGH